MATLGTIGIIFGMNENELPIPDKNAINYLSFSSGCIPESESASNDLLILFLEILVN